MVKGFESFKREIKKNVLIEHLHGKTYNHNVMKRVDPGRKQKDVF